MATTTGYMVVRSDYTTIHNGSSLEVDPASWDFSPGKDATPPTSIDDTFVWTNPNPPPATVTTDYWFEVETSLVQAANRMIQHNLLANGLRLLEVSFDNPGDVSEGAAPRGSTAYPDPGGFPVSRLDVVSEIDEATIRAAATV
jgi:hypothetical protein